MKKNKLKILASLLALSAALYGVAFTTAGCKSPAQAAYTVGQTATVTVEAMMGLWNEFVKQKHPGVEVETKVKAAYDNYRKADIALLTAGKAMLAAQAAGDAAGQTTAETAWHEAEAALSASSAQVYALLKDLGVKLP